jgi:hypothetical protein
MRLSEWIEAFERIREAEGDIEVVMGPDCRPMTILDVVELPSKGIVRRLKGPKVNRFVPTDAFRSPMSDRVNKYEGLTWGSTLGNPK